MSAAQTLPPPTEPTSKRYRFGYWAAAATYVTMQAFGTLPSPLYGLYARRDHLTALMITVVYAAYAVGVAVSLVLAGHLSDTHGRKPILLVALGVNAVSAVVFIVWPSLPGLFVARIVCGVAVGVTASTATAYLGELFLAHRPVAQIRRVQIMSAAASIGGLGVGGLLAGLIASATDHPLVVPYVVALALLGGCALAVLASPETRTPSRPLPRYRPQRLVVPADARRRFAAALAGVAAVFAVFGLFVGLAATLLAGTLHRTSLALSGAVLFVLFGVGALSTAVTARVDHRTLVRVAGMLMLVGPGLLVVSAWLPTPSLTVFVVSAAVIGAGGASLFRASLTVATALAPREHVAETLAGFFLAGYLGLSAPVIGIGLALAHLSVRTTLLGFAVVIAVGVASIVPALARTPTGTSATRQ